VNKVLLGLLLLCPVLAYGALPPADSTGTPMSVKITCYAPGADPNMEGPFATSRPRADGGGSIPYTLDDFRLGKSKYVTLAANPMHYGKWFNMGTVTYVSNLDGRRYTVSSVVGYVHDTGCAFFGSGQKFGKVDSCCQKYGTCSDAFKKMDVAYGDFRANNGNKGLVNSEAYCGNKSATWTQIGGPLTTPPTVSGGQYVGGGNSGGNQTPTSPTPPSSTQPPFQQQGPPPPPAYTQQQAATQPGQYFNNAYSPIPANQPFPFTSSVSTTSSSQSSGSTLGQSLLDLLKPITSGVQTPKPAVTITYGTTSVGEIDAPNSGTEITVTPLNTDFTHSPSQTFVQNYLDNPRPSQLSDTDTLGRMLDTLRSVLNRLLELLRLR
jgi:hypothetical protein